MARPPLLSPLRAVLPAPGRAEDVIAPPYDALDAREARELAAGRPWSFLHVSRAEIDLPEGTDPYADAVYEKAGESFRRMLDAGVLVRDPQPRFYVYRLQMGRHVQTGFVGGASLEAYASQRIRRHELTRPEKEDDRTRHILALEAQTGPALLAYRPVPELADVIQRVVRDAPFCSAPGPGGVVHTLWRIDDGAGIRAVADAFAGQDALYIADGHHRSAAAARARKALTERRGSAHLGDEPYNRFLAAAFPADEMRILGYHRLVKDLNGMEPRVFLTRLAESFTVRASNGPEAPGRREFGLYLDGRWHMLRTKGTPAADPVRSLDANRLSDLVLDPMLGVQDLRRSERVDFVGGVRGLAELQRRVDSGEMAAAFALHPVSLDELMAVADAGRLMPPKSTWFEPKLADGLVSILLE
ncbi:MAG: DUF1015 domain-containing protein [Elusimicrobia bacterium]|nr:DUF1015 domain-containing protein [Elusimicrobiota bacterium]